MSLTDLQNRRGLGPGPLTPVYDTALLFVAEHHRGQLRKGSKVHYLSRLMCVMSLVLEHGGTGTAAIAALLHDAVEDAPDDEGSATLARIDEQLGSTVAEIVHSCGDELDEPGCQDRDLGSSPRCPRSDRWCMRRRSRL
jgi:(p)ppGpp synthase/HD superfamily hydrolase